MIGQTIAHYRITEKLGAGGMGEVYRAHDTRLGRDVAIKVLAESVAGNPERMARFEREAHLLASLNHPNIASVFGLEEAPGTRALVMELVEGPTLADRITQGPVPLEEALPIARQIAEALEFAHEHGVIHRDLKPANVKIKADGTVKVLDFGLAKAIEGEQAPIDSAHSPTLSAAATRAGVLLGTAAYMSPEQARGKAVDKRTDIWAFGCVLFEMLTGQQSFAGETGSDSMAAVLRSDPDWSLLPAATPSKIRALLRRCMQKDPKQRLHDIADARLLIEEAVAEPAEAAVPAAAPRAAVPTGAALGRPFLPWAIALALALLAALMGWRLVSSPSTPPARVVRFSFQVPSGIQLSGGFTNVAMSPDGRTLAYVAYPQGNYQRIYLRRFDGTADVEVAGTERGENLFFSADGQWIGFIAGRKMRKVSIAGGTPQVICDSEWGGGSWGEDGNIVFTPAYPMGLWRVSEAGGQPQKITEPDHKAGELGHWWPQILPGGEYVLYTAFSTPIEKSRILVRSLKTGEQRVLVEGGTYARYVPTGHIIYLKSETLLAVPFDLRRLAVTGPARPVLEDVSFNLSDGNSQLSFSSEGTLAYIPASALRGNRQIVWVDRKGATTPVTEQQRRYGQPQLSPDGRRISVTVSAENSDVWVYDLERGTFTRVTFGAASDFGAVWAPDGRQLVFVSERPVFQLYRTNAGGGEPEALVASSFDTTNPSLTPDGKLMVYQESNPETAQDLWVLPLEGERKPRPFLRTPFGEGFPRLSPDGHWLAYASNESGRWEVYVAAFPGPGERVQISTDGGTLPHWRRDGKELFYRTFDDKMMAVGIQTLPKFSAGKPSMLFQGEFGDEYDVSLDGQRFLMVKMPPENAPRQVNIVLNWFEDLKRAMGTGKK